MQLLVGSYPKFKLQLRGEKLKYTEVPDEDDLQRKTTSNDKKVKYLRNRWSDITQILNVSSGNKTTYER